MGLAQHTEKTDKSCNVCGAAVEIVECAASQCSNRNCLTRKRGDDFTLENDLRTDSTKEEIIKYWKQRAKEVEEECVLTKSEAEEKALTAFEQYVRADSRPDAEDAEIRADTLLQFTDKGWGWLKEESDL